MFYSESLSEPDFSNFVDSCPYFSESKSKSDDSESDFNLVFINQDVCIFFILYLHSSK